jgi:flagellar biosynthesis chaperone FliJ
VARFRFPLAALLEAREREKEQAHAAHARAAAQQRAAESAATALRERQARLRAAIGRHALSAPPDTLRRAYQLMESFDGSVAAANQRAAAAAETAAAAAHAAQAATRAWKQVELLERKARAEHAARVRIAEEREYDEANAYVVNLPVD